MRVLEHRAIGDQALAFNEGDAGIPAASPVDGMYVSLWEADADELLALLKGGRVMVVVDTRERSVPLRLSVVRVVR